MKQLLAVLVTGMLFLGASSSVFALPLVNGGFDENVGLTGTSWGVFHSINGWTTGSGTGIEIQRSTVVAAETGHQYVELDSHYGTDTNSTMYQIVSLKSGDYTLSWMYHARTNISNDDNGITAGISGIDATAIDDSFWHEDISKAKGEQLNVWEQVVSTFTIKLAGEHKLWFGAYGLDNSRGGFIDSVSLTSAPVPEPATMLLFGTGLIGLAGVARRKKK